MPHPVHAEQGPRAVALHVRQVVAHEVRAGELRDGQRDRPLPRRQQAPALAVVRHVVVVQSLHRLQQPGPGEPRSEEHTSELQSLMRLSSAVFCLKKKITKQIKPTNHLRDSTTQRYTAHTEPPTTTYSHI